MKEKQMKTIISEPTVIYGKASWQTHLTFNSSDELICGIEDQTIICCPPSNGLKIRVRQKPKKKLSALRGKLSKQSKKEVDEQISKLRNEWERPI